MTAVSGDLTPDATGTYEPTTVTNGKPAWASTTPGWYVYWDIDFELWILNSVLGQAGTDAGPHWESGAGDDPTAIEYYWANGATGVATFTLP